MLQEKGNLMKRKSKIIHWGKQNEQTAWETEEAEARPASFDPRQTKGHKYSLNSKLDKCLYLFTLSSLGKLKKKYFEWFFSVVVV